MSYIANNLPQTQNQIQYKRGFSQELQADENIQRIIDTVGTYIIYFRHIILFYKLNNN